MRTETYRLLNGLALGAASMLVLLQYSDADRSRDRHLRHKAVATERRAANAAKPVDLERLRELSEKDLAIWAERDNDSWILRNLSFITSGLIFIAVGVSWLEHSSYKMKDA